MATSRQAQLKKLDAIGFDELEVHVGEMVHTAFRKGCDHPQAMTAWRAIRDMQGSAWDDACNWMIEGLRISTGREKAKS